jgi:4'-phosphopantetheinyl transferase
MSYDPSVCFSTPLAWRAEVVLAYLDGHPEAVHSESELLSDLELQRASRFVRDQDRGRFIQGRGTLRRLLGSRLRIPPHAVDLVVGPHGKPALAPGLRRSGLQFNVSHCAQVAAFGFSWGREIGVDVEAVRPVPEADAIARQFFSPREVEAYFALPTPDRRLGFFNCWTRKEAFVKARGDGLAFGLDRFDVSLDPRGPARILRVDREPGERCGWMLGDFNPAPGFVGAVVVQSEMGSVH